jgi:hypothetical protein
MKMFRDGKKIGAIPFGRSAALGYAADYVEFDGKDATSLLNQYRSMPPRDFEALLMQFAARFTENRPKPDGDILFTLPKVREEPRQ